MKQLATKKIRKLAELKRQINSLKAQGKRIVFTNGCFDLIHYGHVRLLQQAKRKGQILVVAINSDSSVRKIKGNGRPVIPQNDRARIVAAFENVDFVTIFSEPTPYRTIKALRPDVLVKGADWQAAKIVGKNFVRSYGGEVLTLPFLKGRSTTGIIEKIGQLNKERGKSKIRI
jgi:D-beta-D-heptose 7-phosphate kinase/D-beta-D-heptose 1-phosphate adenosyltransferase